MIPAFFPSCLLDYEATPPLVFTGRSSFTTGPVYRGVKCAAFAGIFVFSSAHSTPFLFFAPLGCSVTVFFLAVAVAEASFL